MQELSDEKCYELITKEMGATDEVVHRAYRLLLDRGILASIINHKYTSPLERRAILLEREGLV
jgi:hypothetical protein